MVAGVLQLSAVWSAPAFLKLIIMQTIKRGDLYTIEQELLAIQKNYPAFAILLKDKIRLFLQKNNHQLKVMASRLNDVKLKYVQRDEHGTFLTVTVGETLQWKFIDKLTDLENARVLDVSQVAQKFEEECELFFSQSIHIDW